MAQIAGLPFWAGSDNWRAAICAVLYCIRQSWDRQRHYLARLPFDCAEAVGCLPERAIPIAAAWMLLYIAARLFDTVEDQEFEVDDWAGVSWAEAVNIASAFLTAIPATLAAVEDPQLVVELREEFQHTALRMAAGQHADLSSWIGSDDKAVERYWQVVAAKSGSLFALACWAGARLGNPPVEVLTAYSDFGHLLGQIVQVRDDYRDAYDPNNLADFRAGRASLPLVYGRAVAGPREKDRIEYLLSLAASDAQAAFELRQLLDRLGSRHYLLLQIELLRQRAQEALLRASVTGLSLNRLLELVPCIEENL